jgi:hypothetical protein
VRLPADVVKLGGGSSRHGSGALRVTVDSLAAAAAAAAAVGTSSVDSSSGGVASLGGVRPRVRLQGGGSRSRDSSRESSAYGARFFSCSSSDECGSASSSESESESGCDGVDKGNGGSSRAVSPTAAARCAVRKVSSPRSSVVVAKAAAAGGVGGQRLSRFAPQQQAGLESVPHASRATQQLI